MADGAGVLARGGAVVVCHMRMCEGAVRAGGDGEDRQRAWCAVVCGQCLPEGFDSRGIEDGEGHGV